MVTRREAVVLSLAAGFARPKASLAAAASDFGDRRYAAAMVIDALGGPGSQDPNVPEGSPLSAKDIAGFERELAAHADVFTKILTGKDLLLAKSTRRMGLIYGCQDTTMLDGDLKRLEIFYDLGPRICQPTYNRRNLMATAASKPRTCLP